MRKYNSRRPLPYNKEFVRSVSLNKHIYDIISSKLKEEEVKISNDITYYIIEKVKNETFSGTNSKETTPPLKSVTLHLYIEEDIYYGKQ